ncbi:winged helix-turn-helix transcriptional regulator [Nocardia nepalensis]|uniref:winged helix-turn-helix transcriptional regulator n=1 Tax=Nocardia nepalensis TaxID=3375448 RepID=UPI003B67176E
MTIERPANDIVQRVVDVLGDRWTILLIREAFFGVHRFSDFARNIGIKNRNLLTGRLRDLVELGIFERTDTGPGRVDYRLTDRGRDLYAVLVTMMSWGDRHLAGPEGPPLILEHRPCGHPATPTLICGHCHEPLDPRDVDPKPGPGYREPTAESA